ncbi:hypothetical protein Mic7113_1631 [Allocoleopsis franciscana PCC 7113]|uniref:PatU n=2 Tax=Allocoleopsis TaxID=2886347 RepID=K9WD97_9CYAN|nr:hypothetical protein Mic7113_1631 [Allocoleopsis franciscana PCC 7113]
MNSDMYNNSDTLYSRLITWLLEESVPAASPPAEGQADHAVSPTEPKAADFELEPIDPVDLEELNIASFNTNEADQYRAWASSDPILAREDDVPGGSSRPYDLGEMPTVQNRFQAILKRRLQAEIERHPPLFPWETELSDYESNTSDAVEDTWVPPVRLWMPQLFNLTLPVTLPENVLAQLLDACSEAVYSRRQLGAKLVHAVESLFPDQFQALNHFAGMVLLSPAFGGTSVRGSRSESSFNTSANEQLLSLPSSYEAASNEQKMTLALLAAKEIISALTVPISQNLTPVERQWQTSVGVVTVQAEYEMQEGVPKLRVTARLPRGGTLTLRTPQASASAQRIYPGYVSVESFDLQANQTYPLEIRFHDSEQTPLIFAICPTM